MNDLATARRVLADAQNKANLLGLSSDMLLDDLARYGSVSEAQIEFASTLRSEAARRLANDLTPGWLQGRCDGCGAQSLALAIGPVEGIVCERCPDCVRLGVEP